MPGIKILSCFYKIPGGQDHLLKQSQSTHAGKYKL